MIGTGEVERKARKFCRQTLAFERLRHFRVEKNDVVGKAAIREQSPKAIDEHFETLRRFVVGDGYVVEIHGHDSPCDCAGFTAFSPFV